MPSDLTSQRSMDAERQKRAEIIARYALDNAAVDQISALHGATPMTFTEAAVWLGFVRSVPAAQPREPAAVANAETVDRAEQPVALRTGPRLPDAVEARSEDIRRLRTELLMRPSDRDEAQVLAILSPQAGEGRSQLAAELAVAFAQLGEPTLLVDADLRHSRQHLLFNASNDQGLGSALSGHSTVTPVAVAGIAPLFLLCAGPAPQDPLERLSAPHFERLLEEWRQRYRYVVIDTPPVCRYADALTIAHRVGRVLSLSRANHTSYRDTRELLRRLAATRSRILGAVINHF